MTDKSDLNELDTLFSAARAAPPQVPDTLTQRVMADAGATQRGFAPADTLSEAIAQSGGASGGWFRQLSLAIGGWAGMGGLATACAAGVWLGFAPPSGWVDPVSLVYESQGSLDLFASEEVAFLLDQEEW